MLFQGEPYAEFREEWDDYLERPPPPADAIRLINTQTEIVEEALNQPMVTSAQRRQCITYMLEQCILLSSVMRPNSLGERHRFRVLRRMLERARRVARGDGL